MFKEFSIVFCVMSLYLVEDIVMVPLAQVSGQPISQWSGQINGFDTNQTHLIPGYGMGNGMNGAHGSGGNGSNGSNGSNGNGGNGMSNGSGNGMGSGWKGWNNGMGNGSNSSSGWNNGGWNNGMANEWNNGMANGWNNGSNGGNGMGPGNGMVLGNGMVPSNVMGDEWGNGFSGMSWSNSTNSSFGSMQSQANKYLGGGYPSTYYEQFSSQSIIVPTPANVQDLQNTTAPNADSFTNQINANGGNMGNINNPTGFQFQRCIPQSTASTASTVTEGSTDTTETTETTQSTATSEDEGTTTTVASTRKRNKH